LIVVDASVIVDILVAPGETTELSERLLGRRTPLFAPHLIDLEVAHAFRRLVRDGVLDAMRGEHMLEDLSGFPLERFPHTPLLPRIWALRPNFTAYDAAYVALTEGLGARFTTRDARLAAACRDLVDVELV